jgi:hypothetical protein
MTRSKSILSLTVVAFLFLLSTPRASHANDWNRETAVTMAAQRLRMRLTRSSPSRRSLTP